MGARAAALAKFIDYIRQKDGVWICTREQIARHWMENYPPDNTLVKQPPIKIIETKKNLKENIENEKPVVTKNKHDKSNSTIAKTTKLAILASVGIVVVRMIRNAFL